MKNNKKFHIVMATVSLVAEYVGAVALYIAAYKKSRKSGNGKVASYFIGMVASWIASPLGLLSIYHINAIDRCDSQEEEERFE